MVTHLCLSSSQSTARYTAHPSPERPSLQEFVIGSPGPLWQSQDELEPLSSDICEIPQESERLCPHVQWP